MFDHLLPLLLLSAVGLLPLWAIYQVRRIRWEQTLAEEGWAAAARAMGASFISQPRPMKIEGRDPGGSFTLEWPGIVRFWVGHELDFDLTWNDAADRRRLNPLLYPNALVADGTFEDAFEVRSRNPPGTLGIFDAGTRVALLEGSRRAHISLGGIGRAAPNPRTQPFQSSTAQPDGRRFFFVASRKPLKSAEEVEEHLRFARSLLDRLFARAKVPPEERLFALVDEDPDPDIRLRALQALLQAFPRHEGTAKAIVEALGDPEPEVRLAAALASDPPHQPTLEALVRDAEVEPAVRQKATEALSALRREEGFAGGEVSLAAPGSEGNLSLAGKAGALSLKKKS